ncbi:OmpP1/FadL family transporter [Bacteroides faecis]|jgi:hypothetical protein|uniref:OmpP1/FadL family transporter n=1 Tax=Bacteroides faecis TaxID=674529 RepID=UPI00033D1360|nr:outer membrane insertion signal domain protein [Bacteroides faecis CAG:32]
MRKISLIGFVMLIVSIPTFAGGLLTNTNQHVSFLRMLARGASIDIDGVYSNPAGLAFLPGDGLYLSLNGQSAYQTRNISTTFPLFPEEGNRRYYKGTASAPFIPSFQGAYKKGDWTISGSFAVVGGGGKASFDDGLGMFDSMIMGNISQASGGHITPSMYSINSAMDGSQFIYGVQLGLSYKINDWLSVFAGGRMNYFSGGYEGFLTATVNSNIPNLGGTELAAIELDCDQTGWGITPILGADVKLGKWNIGLKYEFLTNLNLENKTRKAEVRASGVAMPDDELNPLASFKDGVNTPSDIPALLTAAVGYEILPTLRASVEYHHFFDKAAGMAGGKEKALKHGTHEFLLGAEWDVTKQLTLSGGFQRTDYGLADDFQSDISFSCDSYSLGFGAAIKMTKHLTMNVAYFWTNYSDYDKITATGSTTYSRTNKVFGLGVDYKF